MGEEEKKTEEKPKEEVEAKKEEKPKEGGEEEKPKDEKPAEGEGGDKPKEGEEAAPPPPPPPPEEVEMRVYMHCEGCARKVKKILKRFEGVDDVIADSKAHKVVVKGKKAAADPMKVVERVQKKTGRKVELLSPLPPPPEEKKEEEKKEEPEPPKPEEKPKEPPVISVVLKVHMHCEACAQAIKKRILKMKGVQSAEPDLKASEVTVKGVFEEAKLAEYVHKRTGRHAAIIKSEPVAPAEKTGDGEAKDEKKAAEGGEEKKDEKDEKKDDKEGGGEEKKDEKEKEGSSGEEKDKDKEKDAGAIAAANLYMHYPQFAFPGGYYAPPRPGYAAYPAYPPPPPAYPPAYPHYPPQIFSDENPNACSVM
ncbi:heavy metal-associated isoprenylated plant protein 7-like [Lolium rigidum]|uniref:heavy metal-associated isoprenylated plant protein 7-like n=1 Tax=Lolium rigidum TaxID=89674 RepID=UPI001F5C21B8|nr:heavy metal-associated isoprenylated plant protein 7-like [Lolium rigidum]